MGSAAVWIGRRIWRFQMRMIRFLDDFLGIPERPGVPGSQGVMSRLRSVEEITNVTADSVRIVLAETRPNDGHSMRDVLHHTSKEVGQVRKQVDAIATRVEVLEQQRKDRDDNS
jgi:hypothetical protein